MVVAIVQPLRRWSNTPGHVMTVIYGELELSRILLTWQLVTAKE
jgi:hypothetical protein